MRPILASLPPVLVVAAIIVMVVISIVGRGLASRWGRTGPRQLARPTSILVSFIAMLLVFALFYFLGLKPYLNVRQAQSWAETPCTIVSSNVGEHFADNGTTYSADIVYGYTFNGRNFTSQRYDFLGGSSSNYRAHQEIVLQHPAGLHSLCYVDPANPANAVMDRSLTSGIKIVGTVTLGMSVVFFCAFIATLSGARWTRR